MRVIVAYCEGMLHPRTTASICAQGYTPELHRMVDERDYPLLIRDLFRSGDDFTMVEHDVESRAGVMGEFEACPEPWCFHGYRMAAPFDECGIDYAPLGMTRFRGGLYGTVAELVEDRWAKAGEIEPYFTQHWCSRDAWLGRYLIDVAGVTPHRHPGDVVHHRNYREEHPSLPWLEAR